VDRFAQYKRYFTDHVRGSPAAVFHNGDIYPNAYDTVHAVSYSKTDALVTVAVADAAYFVLNRCLYVLKERRVAGYELCVIQCRQIDQAFPTSDPDHVFAPPV
jgi:hypothetical protein